MKALALIAAVCLVVVMSLAYYALEAFSELELQRMRRAIAQGRRP